MVRHIISKQAHDLLEAHAIGGKIAPAEMVEGMPGYVWVELDDDITQQLKGMVNWENVADNAQAEADAYSDVIIRLCTGQMGHG